MAQAAFDICEICSAAPGLNYCFQCDQRFCSTCKKAHLRAKGNKNHEFQIGPNINPEEKIICQEHNEIFALDCVQCHGPVCMTCVVTTHSGHRMVKIEDSVASIKTHIKNVLLEKSSELKNNIAKIETGTKSYNTDVATKIQSVQSEAESIKTLVDKKVNSLVKSIKGQKIKDLETLSTVKIKLQEAFDNVETYRAELTHTERTVGDVAMLQKLKNLKTKTDKIKSIETPLFPSIKEYRNRTVTQNDIDNLFEELSLENENAVLNQKKAKKDRKRDQAVLLAQLDSASQHNEQLQRHLAGLKKENDLRRQQSLYDRAYISQSNHDFNQLHELLKREKQKTKELERSHEKIIKGIEHNSKEEIIATLKEDLKRLQNERDDREKEMGEMKANFTQLQTKYSKVVGSKMTDGNPDVADLSDSHRPQKLVEMFSLLFDNKWTDAYEKSDDIGDEKQICLFLLDLFKKSWIFCQEYSGMQLKTFEQALLANESQGQESTYGLTRENSNLLTEIRKQCAKQMLPDIYKRFKAMKEGVNEHLHPYIEGCLEISWYSAINDPPVQYVFDATEQPEDFQNYTKSGKHVDYVVWPAMYLYANGPILYKGVAQFKE